MNIHQNLLGFTIAISLVASADQVQSKENDPAFIIIGPAVTNEYMGSDDYSVVPLIVANLEMDNLKIEFEGLTFRAALAEYKNWTYGLTAEYDFGRDNDIENAIVARMTEIDGVINTGLYATYKVDSWLQQSDEFEFRVAGFIDAGDTHEGMYTKMSMAYSLPMISAWRIQIELETTYANEDYMDTYFGVDRQDSLLSGLTTYNAGSSFRDVTLSTNIGLFSSPKWGVFMKLSATKLLGNAKDSPIVNVGSSSQYLAGIGAYYKF